jgi:hypothetical protein
MPTVRSETDMDEPDETADPEPYVNRYTIELVVEAEVIKAADIAAAAQSAPEE